MLCSAATVSAQTFPDLRHVCAQGIGNDINITWSPITDGCSGFQKIYVYGRVDALQPFQLIDSIPTLTQSQYTHIGAKAISTTWNYFVVYKFLCNGDSSVSRTLAIDFNQPGISNIDSVSVDLTTGKVVVGWRPNPAPDLMAYVVWVNQGVNNLPIDTITNTVFTDTASNPSNASQAYTLTAVDSCWNQSIINTVHRTVFLQSSFDNCGKSIQLNWTAYMGWTNIAGYDVYVRNGTSGGFTLTASNTSTQLSHSYTAFGYGDTLEFYIKAKDGTNGFTSTSNKIRIITRARKFSSRNYLSYATVIDSTSIELKILCDTASDTKKYFIYRLKENEPFAKVAELNYDGIAQTLTYNDTKVEPYLYSYQYRFITTDICDKDLDTSNTAKTIFLSIKSTDFGNDLEWSRYSIWDGGVNQYTIYRGFDFGSGFTWNSITTTVNTDSVYSDNGLPLDIGISGVCYYIEATEQLGNKYGIQELSQSNTVCLVDDVTIYFPNAFAPNEINKLFKPIGANIDYRRTNMQIYARNGQLLKNITDIREGWNGTDLENNPCQDGVYLYICEVFGLNDRKLNFKGTLHLLR